jgi:hypothetical protein
MTFVISAVFAGALQLTRSLFLVPYVGAGALFLALYVRAQALDPRALVREHWVRGAIGALLVSIILVQNVRSQPGSSRGDGLELVFQLLWFGVAYGAMDGLLLSVLPVVAVERTFENGASGRTWPARRAIDALALAASVTIAVVYHLGYPEFRSAAIVSAIVGNGLITLSYLVTRNPVAPVLAHVIMHVAAVLHGPASTVQLPPHY